MDTYTNDDVVAFARVLTGMDRQGMRGNTENPSGINSVNVFDPMQQKPSWHDVFPKTRLGGVGYLGDRYPGVPLSSAWKGGRRGGRKGGWRGGRGGDGEEKERRISHSPGGCHLPCHLLALHLPLL